MKILFGSLLVAALLATASVCVSQEFGRLDVIVRPFEALGQADAEFTKALRQNLARAIENQSDYQVTSSGLAYYYLKGQVLSDEKRHTVTLQLFKAKTDRQIWIATYDYRRTTADAMATDVIDALYSVPHVDTWD